EYCLPHGKGAKGPRPLQKAVKVLMGPAYVPPEAEPEAAAPEAAAPEAAPEVTAPAAAEPDRGFAWSDWTYWVYWHAGSFLLAVLYNATFRHHLLDLLGAVWRGASYLFWDLPWKLLPIETIHRLLSTWVFQLLYWYVLKPALVVAVLVLFLPTLRQSWLWTGVIFVTVSALLNSRPGRAASEGIRDGMI